MKELKVYISLLKHLFSLYYEKQMISYDESVCQWYSRYLGRYMSINELEELFYDITTDFNDCYQKYSQETECDDY